MAYDPNDPKDKKILQDAVDAALAEANEQHEADVAGLKAKNTELRGKLAKAKAGEGEGDNAAEVERLETQLAEATKNLKAAEKRAAKAEGDLTAVAGERDSLNNNLQSVLIDQGLTTALTSAKVDAKFLPAVTAMLRGKVTLAGEGDDRKAVVGNEPLGEFITKWSQGDEGKHYISAPVNGGGGGGGNPQGGGGGTGKTMARSAFDALPPAEQMAFSVEGGALTDG